MTPSASRLLRLAPLPAALLALAACAPAEPPAPAAPDMVSEIPAAMQGRWALEKSECTADPAIAKGLMTVDATTLHFYESRAVLRRGAITGPTRLEGRFDFTGEGQEWTRQEVLDVRLSGEMLVRREVGPDAAPDPFFYHACPEG